MVNTELDIVHELLEVGCYMLDLPPEAMTAELIARMGNATT